MSEELKPCPFCGKQPELKIENRGYVYRCTNDIDCGCYAFTEGRINEAIARESWNDRAGEKKLFDEVDEKQREMLAVYFQSLLNKLDDWEFRQAISDWVKENYPCEECATENDRTTCTWTYNDDGGFYETECGNGQEFTYAGINANGYRYCPYCGKEIQEKSE